MKGEVNKNVLIVTYYWPPSGGSAVQRWLSYANHLAKLGFQVYVLTVSENTATYPLLDSSLIDKIDSKIKVFKTDTKGVFSIYKKFIGKGKVPSAGFANEGKPNMLQLGARFVRGNFFLPDARKSWNQTAIPKSIELINEFQVGTIITAGPPHSSHLIGKNVVEKFKNVYWIADFHDAWTDVWYYDKLFKTKPIIALDRRMEKAILKKANHVLVVGEYLKEVLSSKIDAQKEKFSVISMGYNDEIDQLKKSGKNTHFTITYTGTIDIEYHPEVIIKALKRLLTEQSSLKIKLKFVGLLSPSIKEVIIEEGLGEILEETGYVSHEESIHHLIESDSLLLISPEVKSEKIIIPGKLYEYLAAQKPIINIGHLETDTARIVSLCGSGRNFNRAQEDEVLAYIKELYVQWELNDIAFSTTNKTFQNYRRSREAQKIAEIIESKKTN